MRRIAVLVFAFLLLVSAAKAQTITVVDKITRESIPGVVIYSNNPKVSSTTNAKGEVDISIFINADSIFFKHIVYKQISFSFAQIKSMKSIELEETNISLSELTISANRWEEEQSEVPNKIEKITIREARFQNPQTSADLLGTSGYAYIQKSQLAGGSPMLRGFSTNRVMLVVDGVRMNNAIFRAGNVQNVISIDASALESTEILFGPGAVMYGSDAIGGVMDFHTLTPKLADSAQKVLFSGNAFGRYSSANTEKTGHLDFNIGLKKFAFTTSFTYSDYDDLRTGSNGSDYYLRPTYQETINGVDTQFVNSNPQKLVHSGFSQVNAMQKIRFRPNKNWDVEYAFHYSQTSDAPRYDRLYLDANNDSLLDFAQWYYGPQKWMMNRLGITNSKQTKVYDRLRIVAALQNNEESRHDRRFNNKRLRNQTETVDAYSLNIDLDKSITDKITLFYGAEGVYNSIGSVANRINIETLEEEPTNTRYPNGSTWQVYGAYANLKYKIVPKIVMNAGLRYSHYFIKADFDTTQFPFPFTHAENNSGAFNGSLGFVFSPLQTWQIYVNGSTGFRAPNMDDLGKVFESEPGSVVVPNDDLKPEYAYNAEIGTAKTFGNFLKADAAVYFTYLDNALARRNFQYNGEDSIMYDGDLSQVQAIQNIANAYVYGVQAGIDVSFGLGIGLRSTISYQYGEEESEDSLLYYPKSHVPPLFGSTHLIYERKKFKFDFYADYNAAMAFNDLPLTERNDNAPYAKDENGNPFVPAWYTLNFKAAYYINKYVSLNAGIENITNQLYRPYASGISAPGRNFIVALRGKF